MEKYEHWVRRLSLLYTPCLRFYDTMLNVSFNF